MRVTVYSKTNLVYVLDNQLHLYGMCGDIRCLHQYKILTRSIVYSKVITCHITVKITVLWRV